MTTGKIVDALLPLAVDVGSLTNMPGNPRRGDVEAVVRSYERFGQRKPIVALRDGTVIAGNHQLAAAQALGWDHIAVVYVDDDETTAKAFALADNRTSDLGSYDLEALAEMMADVAVDPDLLLDTGYDVEYLDALLAGAENLDDDDTLDEFDVVDPDTIKTQYACPSCGYEWSGGPQPGKPTHEPTDDD